MTKVKVTPDMLEAKAYLSIFPEDKTMPVLKEIKEISNAIKHQLAMRIKNQLRRLAELKFFYDDTVSYLNDVEEAFKAKKDVTKN